MKKREFLYDNGEDFIIWSEDDRSVELICVKGDRVYYYLPNRLPDMILLTQLMEKMNISEDGRNGIRNTIMELYDEFKLKSKK